MTSDVNNSDKSSLMTHQRYGSMSYGPLMIDQRPISYFDQVHINDSNQISVDDLDQSPMTQE